MLHCQDGECSFPRREDRRHGEATSLRLTVQATNHATSSMKRICFPRLSIPQNHGQPRRGPRPIARSSLKEYTSAGMTMIARKIPMSKYPMSTEIDRSMPRSMPTPANAKSIPPKSSARPPVRVPTHLISSSVRAKLRRSAVPTKPDTATTVTIVPKPKKSPGRKASQAVRIAGTATVLTNSEKPPKPKPAMKPWMGAHRTGGAMAATGWDASCGESPPRSWRTCK